MKKRWSPVRPSITGGSPCSRDVAAVGGISDFEPAEVAEVLAERQLALDVHARDRLVAVELRGEPSACAV